MATPLPASPSWRARIPAVLFFLGLIILAAWIVHELSIAEPHPQTAIAPESDVAWYQQILFQVTVYAGVAVAVVVEVALLFAIWRYRMKPGDPRPRQIHGNTRLEITWTIIPFLILTAIAIPTVQVIFSTAATAAPTALHIRAIGHQWWWEFQYTDGDTAFVTANEFHAPTNRVVSIQLATTDVMHSFWIPKMGGKRDNIPNHINDLWFTTPNHPGVYPGQCAEFCGIAHAHMSMKFFVDTPAQFAAWVARQRRPAPAPTTALEQSGRTVFLQSGCIACHSLMGTMAQGTLGPNLSHVGSRTTLGAALLTNTPANMALWIHDPGALKPGALMPPQPLSAPALKAVVAYLQSRK